MFENLKFQVRFLRARSRERSGDYGGAAELLNHAAVPDRFHSLRDAYRLRMLVLSNAQGRGPEIMAVAEALPWFRAPKSPNDEYARDYCKYVAAGVRGDVAERERWARELPQRRVKGIYRHALFVTI